MPLPIIEQIFSSSLINLENDDFHNKIALAQPLDSSPKSLESNADSSKERALGLSLRDDEVGEAIHNTMDSSSTNADSRVDCHATAAAVSRNDSSLDSHPQPLESTFAYKAPDDYKFHCFNEQIFIQVDTERFTSHTRTMFDTEWNKMDFSLCFPQPKYTPQPPNNPQLMIEIATILARHCSYVRVDLYAIDTGIIVGELTYTHGGGTEKFTPNEWDKKLGDLWILV